MLTENSIYDDDPFERYHFPNNGNNLAIAREAIGDWIVYYQSGTKKAEVDGGRSYMAAARVRRIDDATGHSEGGFYARMSDYTEFEKPLNFRLGEGYFENAGLGRRNHWQRSIRRISDDEFERIVRTAMEDLFDPKFARRYDIDQLDETEQSYFYNGPGKVARPIEEVLLNRKVRDRNFRKNVRAAYRNKCAVTHFDLTNGGGRPEVQACHNRPVEEGGPDVVQNGVALSGTIHWMFDKGLISFSTDHKLLISDVTPVFHPAGTRVLS